MKRRWKITVGTAVAVAGVTWLLSRPNRSEQIAAEETRRVLREQGFKTDLAEFNFFTSPELRAREAALTNAGFNRMGATREDYAHLQLLQGENPDLMAAVAADAAVVAWKTDPVPESLPGEAWRGGFWTGLRGAFEVHRAELDAACAAALSGPIRFDLNASHGNAMLLPQLATLKGLAQTLGKRVVLELHDQNKAAAWTNLMAATRLVTAWETEPVEISQLVRFGCAAIAYNMAWQALQADGWTDDQLATLQGEWASIDFFKGLPETAAFARASAVAMCEQDRQQPVSSGMTFKEMVRAPRYAWQAFIEQLRRNRYRNHGSYEDQMALLLHYRNRELELRHAVQSANWLEMRQLPGVANVAPFASKNRSRVQTIINMKQMTLNFSGQGQGLMARAADAETRRRIIVTAIALERFRARHGSYPNALAELTPDLLKASPVDFMDGQPLRYRLAEDRHFALYSVGLDCEDNGGQMPRPGRRGIPQVGVRDFGIPQGTDLVWPRATSAAELELHRREQLKVLIQETSRVEKLQANAQWEHSARRQAHVEKILAAKPDPRTAEPSYHDRPLGEVLANPASPGTNKLALRELLTLRQIVTGEEPEIATFEVPAAYDVLTNLGSLELFVDPVADEQSDEGCQALWSECRRATNGNCLLVWNTIYETPGKHALQIGLELNEPAKRDEDLFTGPAAPFFVGNFCEFSVASSVFNPQFGGTLRAKLPEPNATYTVSLALPGGKRVRTISGATSNGVLEVFWDLTDDLGHRCTNNAYDTVFHVTLTDSGRSQTRKGP